MSYESTQQQNPQTPSILLKHTSSLSLGDQDSSIFGGRGITKLADDGIAFMESLHRTNAKESFPYIENATFPVCPLHKRDLSISP